MPFWKRKKKETEIEKLKTEIEKIKEAVVRLAVASKALTQLLELPKRDEEVFTGQMNTVIKECAVFE